MQIDLAGVTRQPHRAHKYPRGAWLPMPRPGGHAVDQLIELPAAVRIRGESSGAKSEAGQGMAAERRK